MRDREVIYHNECLCLFADNVRDDNCKKRYYECYDFIDDRRKDIFICNEVIRCELHKRMAILDGKERIEYRTNIVADIARDIIWNYLTKMPEATLLNKGKDANSLFKKKYWIRFCERPYLYMAVPFTFAVEVLCDSKFRHSRKRDIIREVENYLLENRYQKYKTRYRNLSRLIRKFKCSFGDEAEVISNEIFIELYELKIKDHNETY